MNYRVVSFLDAARFVYGSLLNLSKIASIGL